MATSNGRHRIRRSTHLFDGTKKLESYPTELLGNCIFKEDYQAICDKENYILEREERVKREWNIKNEFLERFNLREDFYKFLFDRNGNERYSKQCVSTLDRYYLGFWDSLGILDPHQWTELPNEEKLINWLKNEQNPMISARTIDLVRTTANHFLQFIHVKSKGDFPWYKTKFLTWQGKIVSRHEGIRKQLLGDKAARSEGEYIPPNRIEKILKSAHKDLYPAIFLSAKYGLRLSESLAVTVDDLFEPYLSIDKQLDIIIDGKPVHTLTKNNGTRYVPHWNTSHDLREVYEVVKSKKLISRDNFSRRFRKLMDSLGYNHRFHSLRNTWVTDMLDSGKSLHEVQMAAGHSSRKTTEQYIRTDRTTKPKKLAFT